MATMTTEIKRNFDLYLNAGVSAPVVIHANQYDSGEVWRFKLYAEGGYQYIPTTGAIVGIKSDGKAILNAGTVDSSGCVVITETEQMTASPGKAVYELLIQGQTHGTANFIVSVEARPGDNADFSDSDLSMLQDAAQAITEVNELLDKLDISIDTYNSLSSLEKRLALEYARRKNGKVFATKVYNYDSNTSAVGERLMDSIGMVCEPSTDTVEGRDDFLQYSIFQWSRCNYVRDSDGFARPIAMKGSPAFRTEGAYDVGTIAPTFYWKQVDYGTYKVFYMSDSPHPELGLVPWVGAVKADGTVMPYYIYSAYPSVTASDGMPRSQPGKAPVYNQSHNNMIASYQAKGNGYWGAGNDRTALGYLFYMIKYANKSSQAKLTGCTAFNTQVLTVTPPSNTKVVQVSSDAFYVGCCVSISAEGLTAVPNRGSTECNALANRVKVRNITEENGVYSLELDIDEELNASSNVYVSPMPCLSGETDAVIGIHDGSYLSNTNSRHTYRIQGIEYNWGLYMVASDSVIEFIETDTRRGLYVAPKGVAHVTNAHTGYTYVGELVETDADLWIGDISIDEDTGALYPTAKGGSSATGCGDYLWRSTGAVGAMREYLQLGALYSGSYAGLCFLSSSAGLGHSSWYLGSCD